MINEFLVISDLHLEKRNENQKEFLLNVINNEINTRKLMGYNPIIVCPGDLDNGVKGLGFLSKINAEVVYLCGNHEFWGCEYEETKENIKNSLPTNVKFLDNDFALINDFLFVGGTMWSDLGKDFNSDLFAKSAMVMRDDLEITHRSWYDNDENKEKVKSLYSHWDEKMIAAKSWNIFIEREENEKTVNYLNNFAKVFSLFKMINIYVNTINNQKNSNSEYYKISPEKHKDLMTAIMSYKDVNHIHDWLENIEDFSFVREANILMQENIDEKNQIFQKLKSQLKVNDIDKIKLICVSHHLPFIEERLVGRQEWFDDEINSEYFYNLKDSLYALRKGLDYDIPNYFYRLNKGDFSKSEAITQVLHYSNDGSSNFSHELIENTYAWVHGHEHAYNYEDIIKGIKIITAPLSYSMDIFNIKDEGKVSLNEKYKKYNNIQDEDEQIKKLKESFLRKSDFTLNKYDFNIAVYLWALKNFNWDKYKNELYFLLELNKDLFQIINDNYDVKVLTKENIHNAKLLAYAINNSLSIINDMEWRFKEGVLIRTLPDYSFNLKYGKSLPKECLALNAFKNFLKKVNLLELEIFKNKEDRFMTVIGQDIHENIYLLEKSLNIIKELKDDLDSYDINRLIDVTINMVIPFENILDKIVLKNQYSLFERNEMIKSYNSIIAHEDDDKYNF